MSTEDMQDAPVILDNKETDNADIVNVTSLDGFVAILNDWHAAQVAIVNHIAQVPEGIEVKIGDDDDGETFRLEGDTMKGFQLGLSVAMSYLGKLPFVCEYESTIH